MHVIFLQNAIAEAVQLPNSRISEDIMKDAMEVIVDSSHKMELYCGHRVCVANQQFHFYKIIQDMEKQCLEKTDRSDALIVADSKMKFKPMPS